MVNFPDLSGNIPKDGSYGVFIAQTLRYAKACTKYHDFIARTQQLIGHLTNQSFNHKKLIKKLKKWMRTSPKSHVMNKFGRAMDSIWIDLNKTSSQ